MSTELIQPRISTTVKRTHALVLLQPLALDGAVSEPTCVIPMLSDRRPAVTPKVLSLGTFSCIVHALALFHMGCKPGQYPRSGNDSVEKSCRFGAWCPDERAEVVRIMELAWLPISA